MIAASEEKLQAALAKLSSREQAEVLDFAEFLAHRQIAPSISLEEHLSEEEHIRIVAALDAVAALSQATGSSVSNREHDTYLYGER